MPIVVEAGAAAARRTAVVIKDYTNTENEDENYYATLYMGAPPDTADEMKSGADDKSLPQAYLVEQPPHATVPPHFHDTDQFQVFVHGKANFGKQQVLPLSVHYAGGHTPYGPIATEQEGAHYFTLRANWDSGGKPMPASRNLLKRGQQCHSFAEVSDALPPSTMAAVDCDPLLPVEEDGLGASMFTLQAGEAGQLDLGVAGAGQYALVIAGEVDYAGSTLGENSCVFRFAQDAPLSVTAGGAAARVLLMQFPAHG